MKTAGGHGPSNIILGHRLDAHAAMRAGQRKPPQAVLDRLAERSITGGFPTSRRHQCPACFQQRARSGACAC